VRTGACDLGAYKAHFLPIDPCAPAEVSRKPANISAKLGAGGGGRPGARPRRLLCCFESGPACGDASGAQALNLTPLAKQTVPSNPTQRGSRPQETAKMLRKLHCSAQCHTTWLKPLPSPALDLMHVGAADKQSVVLEPYTSGQTNSAQQPYTERQ
jgi:hypothetical protein